MVNVRLVWFHRMMMKVMDLMKVRQLIQLLLIAFFVLAFQSTDIHVKHYTLDEISECNLSHTSDTTNQLRHHSTKIIVTENLAVKVRKKIEKVVIRSGFDYIQIPLKIPVDMRLYQQHVAKFISLGFNATAPPYIIS